MAVIQNGGKHQLQLKVNLEKIKKNGGNSK